MMLTLSRALRGNLTQRVSALGTNEKLSVGLWPSQ